MKILVTGGTGFVGGQLVDRLVLDGHSVTVLSRTEPAREEGAVRYLQADPHRAGSWQQEVAGHDAAVNLAGASIFNRWTDERKRELRDSRIDTTRNLVDAMPQGGALLSASAVGYYGAGQQDTALDEQAPPGDDFLARLCRDWEAEAQRAETKGVRVVRARIGVVLGRGGGALEQMARPFRMFVGGKTGKGRQWFSWIHMDDLTAACSFLLSHEELSGAFNLTAPEPVQNRDFAKALGRALHRPSWLPVPGFALRAALGEFGKTLLEGQRVVPARLSASGFSFRFPQLDTALADLLESG